MRVSTVFAALALCCSGAVPAPQAQAASPLSTELDAQLQALIKQHQLKPIATDLQVSPEQVELGQLLFFDKILSGSQDIACATCHHPRHHSGDDLSLSIGLGGEGLGGTRKLGQSHTLITRNAPEIFNRGNSSWRSMFWDGRVEILADGKRRSPADDKLPDNLDNVLAMQAMFPVTSPDEMRGRKGDLDIAGYPNTLAAMGNEDFESIWGTIMRRILSIPEYVDGFRRTYPDTPTEELNFAHAANAIAAFQIDAFSFSDSPWDRYLAGDTEAMDTSAKQGAILFYGRANCASCHSGILMTDQNYYNIMVPQIGPGHRDSSGFDIGRARVTDKKSDAFAFRTPPLRNVALTGPWMHNGSYKTLTDVIEHHAAPLDKLQNYDVSQLTPELAQSFRNNTTSLLVMAESFSGEINRVPALSSQDITRLIAFLEALTSPQSQDLSHLIPPRVPSGLPVNR